MPVASKSVVHSNAERTIRPNLLAGSFVAALLMTSSGLALAQDAAPATPAPVATQPSVAPSQSAATTDGAGSVSPSAASAPTGRIPADTQQPAANAPAPSAAPAQSQAATPIAPAAPTAGPTASPPPTAAQTPVPDLPAAAQAPSVTPLSQPGERSDIPHNLSPWGMFMAADWVVKSVMSLLAAASLITWTIWVAKTLEMASAKARARRAIKIIRSSRTLQDALQAAGSRGGPAAHMLRAAAEEVQVSEAALDYAHGDGLKERVSSIVTRIESVGGRKMSRGTGILATIGSVAPFVGLFGTVWGIMNSFIGISQAHTTNLAVVAPGIAEALLATAIGLVAAIPAVVIYNVFARAVTGYRQLLADAAAGVERLVSRDLDFRKVPAGSRKASVSVVTGA